jgi:stage V sporulation protein R|tara:strand:+ start:257 stop:1585 length:1329 start_codon:yes stop_codon:yes gene_type:complete
MSLSDYSTKDLSDWDEKICEIARSYGLDWFDINYEICDYYEMIGHMSYHGMPSHYNHWSYGKTFERTHLNYNMGQSGLPYEMIINSNPSIAYLMMQNPLYLQVLIMAHCVGHSDFFKNNRCFKDTDPDHVVSRMRNAKKRIQGYIEDPSIGQEKVESFLDSLHAIKYQTNRYGIPRQNRDEIKAQEIKRFNAYKKKGLLLDYDDLETRRLLKPDHDMLSFFTEYYPDKFSNWQLDLLEIVKQDSWYFMPQIQTKILNEGWASFWHYKILHDLKLPDSLHLPFLKMHNAVVRPHLGGVNPYHVGFYIFQKMEREHGLERCFEIRSNHDDVAALRMLLDEEDFRELNFFAYENKKDGSAVVTEVTDHDDWQTVRNEMIIKTGINMIPHIYVDRVDTDGTLVLKHEHDGRDLDLDYADKVMDHVRAMWDKEVKLFTIIEEEVWEI